MILILAMFLDGRHGQYVSLPKDTAVSLCFSFEILELHRRVLCVIDDLSDVSFVNPEKVGIDETSPLWRGRHDVLLSTASRRNEDKPYDVYGLTVQSITEFPNIKPLTLGQKPIFSTLP